MADKKMFRKGIVVTPGDFNGVDWVDLMKKGGLNTLGLHSGGGSAHNVIERLGEFGEEPFQQRCREYGVDYEYELHAPHHLMDYTLFASHPEYFVQTLRSRERSVHGNWCMSSPAVPPMLAANTAKLTMRLPSSTHRYFYWGVDTASGDWCHCDGCAQWSASEQNLLTANTIARRLREKDPSAEVACLAYWSTLSAPRRVQPEKNVFAEFAPYQRCYEHALCDGNCAVNRDHLAHLLDWINIFSPERIHVLEYWLDSSLFGFDGVPHRVPCRSEVIKQDVAFYASLGIRSITTFAVRLDRNYFDLYGDKEFIAYCEALKEF